MADNIENNMDQENVTREIKYDGCHSSCPWRDKYGAAIQNLQRSFQETVLVAQKQAEINAEESKAAILILKEQLLQKQEQLLQKQEQISQQETEINELKTELEMYKRKPTIEPLVEPADTCHTSPDSSKGAVLSYKDLSDENSQSHNPPSLLLEKRILDFFQTITCLNVTMKTDNVYYCTIEDGLLSGHEFEVGNSTNDYEFQYRPVKTANIVMDTDELAKPLAIPDYMLPKFLMMLLKRTYQINEQEKQEQPETIILSGSDD